MRETIFVLSSGRGTAGIAVIRMSGDGVRRALEALCGTVPPPRRAALRSLRDPATGDVIDRALVLFFPGPDSVTGEDVGEFHVHGGVGIVKAVLGCIAALPGFCAAEAGEFTRRAFDAGRMDLVEVETLADLLSAETATQARLMYRHQDSLRKAAGGWREDLLALRALTEAYIDFSDEPDVVSRVDSDSEQIFARLHFGLSGAIQALGRAERIRNGFRVAIMGPPNAGKSTLLNALAARDVAITSEIPGTTRDIIEVHLDLGGIPVTLVDTAGIRDTRDPVEAIGIERAREAARSADLVLWLVPAGAMVAEDGPPGSVILHTKCDLSDSVPVQSSPLVVSAARGDGITALLDWLAGEAERAVGIGESAVMAMNARQAGELGGALDALARAQAVGIDALEIRAEELLQAARCLDRITGRINVEEVLGRIFSRFCIGK